MATSAWLTVMCCNGYRSQEENCWWVLSSTLPAAIRKKFGVSARVARCTCKSKTLPRFRDHKGDHQATLCVMGQSQNPALFENEPLETLSCVKLLYTVCHSVFLLEDAGFCPSVRPRCLGPPQPGSEFISAAVAIECRIFVSLVSFTGFVCPGLRSVGSEYSVVFGAN